jgi:hypothetical protein
VTTQQQVSRNGSSGAMIDGSFRGPVDFEHLSKGGALFLGAKWQDDEWSVGRRGLLVPDYPAASEISYVGYLIENLALQR